MHQCDGSIVLNPKTLTPQRSPWKRPSHRPFGRHDHVEKL